MTSNKKILALAVAAAPLLATQASAQNDTKPTADPGPIEEVVIVARLKSSAENVVFERLEHEAVTDLLSSELIGRIGDSNVATALRRVPGVTLVDDKFIYVRGLGERYSSTLLNGAAVPTPDLTRSVLPLDIFPTSIVESLAVQKGFTADIPAAFGGGNVDIRTRGIPDELVFNVEIGTNYNAETSGSGLTYRGGGDDEWGHDDGTRTLPAELGEAFKTYRGNISPSNILTTLRQQGNTSATLTDAQLINRQLATSLMRDVNIDEDKPGENLSGEVNVGNRFYFNNGMEFGFLSGLSYDHTFDTSTTLSRSIADPDEQVERETESTREVNLTGNLGLGFRLNEDNEVSTTSLYLLNSDDVAAISDYHNDNRPLSGGTGFRDWNVRYQEREMLVNQVKGSHSWGEETRNLLGLEHFDDMLPFLDQLKFDWYYSDAVVDTDIPSEVRVIGGTQTEPGTGQVLTSTVQANDAMAGYRFTDLEDEVLSQGWELSLPMFVSGFDIEVSGGWDYVRKNRTYRQTDLILGSTDPDVLAIVTDSLSDLFGDDNILNPDYGFTLNVTPASARSYLAATTNESMFFKADITWQDSWRVIAGTRYEEYVQVGLPWEPLNYSGSQISMDPVELEEAVFTDDKVYPSLSVVYMGQEFWAETFQVRLNYSETVVRPDLREISDTSYLDPITGALVFGNPDVVPADVKNYDIRAEWFFDNGDNFTVSLFYKDIIDPIESFERGASDTKVASEIINAESAELYGIEIEWLKELLFLGEALSSLFFSGNVTLLDHELQVGDRADSPTNKTRGLAGASDYVLNFQLGYDSDDGRHAATVVYNVFGERLYTAGRLGFPDAFEQPFNSLDLTYSFYPTDNVTVKAKLKNLLDESVTIERGGVDVFEEERGMEASLSARWQF
jgi:outer membrane receptor protein involved in Fe transport